MNCNLRGMPGQAAACDIFLEKEIIKLGFGTILCMTDQIRISYQIVFSSARTRAGTYTLCFTLGFVIETVRSGCKRSDPFTT